MASSIKVILRQKKNKDGTVPTTFPLAIRITTDRKSSFIYIGHKIKPTEWDDKEQRVKKNHPNSARLNNLILKRISEVSAASIDLEVKEKKVSSQSVKQKIKPKRGLTFFPIADLYLENLQKAGKYNQYTADKPRIKHFKTFLKDSDKAFFDITVSLLQQFKLYLKSEYKITYNVEEKKPGKRMRDLKKRPIKKTVLSERSIINHLVAIRSVFSLAVKEGAAEKADSPFGEGKISIKFPPSNKIGLTEEEVKAIEALEFSEGTKEAHARNLWLFSFYLAGMRVSDILRLRWSNIKDDRLYYAMGKNQKTGSLKLPEKAHTILSKYKKGKQSSEAHIFPELEKLSESEDSFIIQKKIADETSKIDKCLRLHVAPAAGIEKTLTMHIARHTFGNISGDRIPIQMLQKLYRHSSVTTTIGYQSNFTHKEADDALESVVNL